MFFCCATHYHKSCTYIEFVTIIISLLYCVNFIVPTPLVQITISDNETMRNLTVGDPLTLDCTVTAVRGISSSVNIVWTTGGIELRRVDNITADIVNDSAIYTDSFEISSLSALDNGREYQCTVMINATQPVNSSDQFIPIFPGEFNSHAYVRMILYLRL